MSVYEGEVKNVEHRPYEYYKYEAIVFKDGIKFDEESTDFYIYAVCWLHARVLKARYRSRFPKKQHEKKRFQL